MADDSLRPAGIPERLHEPLEACARGELAPNVALMRMLIAARSADEVERTIEAAGGAARSDALSELWHRSAGAFEIVKSVMARADHASAGGPDGLDRWAAAFDEVAGISPEAGVALYSLGSPALLGLATVSIADRLRAWGLLGRERTVLDLGCGMGRISAAIAGEVRTVVGIDISSRMLAAARRQCAGHGNVLFIQTSGRDLALFPDGLFDLVLAVDTFPYLVLAGAGLVETHLQESRRVLRPGGSLVIFNYAYGEEVDKATETFHHLAANTGFEAVRLGTRDLAWWDGITYHVRRKA